MMHAYATPVEELIRISRKADIADAAIKTLAAEGMRGLTHRAVDRTAGLPEGSTSYYFRTRSALLEAVLDRFIERLDEDLAAWPELGGDSPDDGDVADQVAELMIRWATTNREAQIARYELVLESTRRPELRPQLMQARTQVQRVVSEHLGATLDAAGVDDAYWFTAPFEGMLLYLVIRGDESLTRQQITDAVRRFIDPE